jgi:hypothetical protein
LRYLADTVERVSQQFGWIAPDIERDLTGAPGTTTSSHDAFANLAVRGRRDDRDRSQRDPRCARPAELGRLLGDIQRVLHAMESCEDWLPWRIDWRERLADAVTIHGDIVTDAEALAERVSGMDEVRTMAVRLCAALDATFGVGSLDSAGGDFPIYPCE